MKENLRKIKNIIGLSALVILSSFMFLGINFQLANGLAAAFLAVLFVSVAILFLFLALKGREERRGHSSKWIAIGWGATALYVLTLVFSISDIERFISVNQNKTTIQASAKEKIEAMEFINTKYYEKVDLRCEELKVVLQNLIFRHDEKTFRLIYPAHSGDFTMRWALKQRDDLFAQILNYEVDKLSYNMIVTEWNGAPQTKSSNALDAIEDWNVLSISQSIQELDTAIAKNILVMSSAFQYQDPYSRHFQITHTYNIDDPYKSQLEKKIYIDYFKNSEQSQLGIFIALFLILLASFPVIFVPLNRVTPIKLSSNIYDSGIPVSDFSES